MKTKWNFFMVLALLAMLVGMSARLAQAHESISSVSPAEGTVGSMLTITGSDFGDKRGEVLIGTEKCQVLDWSDSRITCQVHKPQPPGRYMVTVLLQGGKKPTEPLAYPYFSMQRPQINPEQLYWDSNSVTVAGEFFGDKKGEVRLSYLYRGVLIKDAKILDWNMSAIRFALPKGLSGRFLMRVRNPVGEDYKLMNLSSDGLMSYVSPPGYGEKAADVNSSAVYYRGKLYVFSIHEGCNLCDDSKRIQMQTFINGKLSGLLTIPKGETDAQVVPLVIEDKLWLFHTGHGGQIWYGIFDGLNWANNISWKQIIPITPAGDTVQTHSSWEVAPVYNSLTHEIAVYYGCQEWVDWVVSSDYGETWEHKGRVPGLNHEYREIEGGISAIGYLDSNNVFWTVLAYVGAWGHNLLGTTFVDASSELIPFYDMNFAVNGRPFLMEYDSNTYVLIYRVADLDPPKVRKITKGSDWENTSDYHPLSSDWVTCFPPSGAVNYESSDRIFYLLWGYDYQEWSDEQPVGPKWMMTEIEDLGAGVPPGPPAITFSQVSSGQWHTCAKAATGEVGCWGDDGGTGRTKPPDGIDFKQVSSGSWHTCGIKADDDTVVCWGDDGGTGRTKPPEDVKFKQISAGSWHTCGIKLDDETAVCWGDDDGGRKYPPTGVKFSQIDVADWHGCGVVRSSGAVDCWGIADNHRTDDKTGPFLQVSAGNWHNCAVTTTGDVTCWGDNGANRVSPVPPLESGLTYTQVTAGDWHSCALVSNGSIDCWGTSDDGRVSSAPTTGVFTQLDAGDRHTCAIRDDGYLVCWGTNSSGQCNPPY